MKNLKRKTSTLHTNKITSADICINFLPAKCYATNNQHPPCIYLQYSYKNGWLTHCCNKLQNKQNGLMSFMSKPAIFQCPGRVLQTVAERSCTVWMHRCESQSHCWEVRRLQPLEMLTRTAWRSQTVSTSPSSLHMYLHTAHSHIYGCRYTYIHVECRISVVDNLSRKSRKNFLRMHFPVFLMLCYCLLINSTHIYLQYFIV